MKVKELFSVWLYRCTPKIEVKIWSRNKVDYIFSTVDSQKYDLTTDQVDELEVGCFYEYYDKEKDLEMLIINVE